MKTRYAIILVPILLLTGCIRRVPSETVYIGQATPAPVTAAVPAVHVTQQVAATTATPFGVTSTVAAVPAMNGAAHESWIRTQGLMLYYNYARYLPSACTNGGTATLVGNAGFMWYPGWTQSVQCLGDGWLAVDFNPLVNVADPHVPRAQTYCVSFRSPTGAWGQHGAQNAPGLASFMVPAARGEAFGRNIGIQVRGNEIVLTNTGHSWNPC